MAKCFGPYLINMADISPPRALVKNRVAEPEQQQSLPTMTKGGGLDSPTPFYYHFLTFQVIIYTPAPIQLFSETRQSTNKCTINNNKNVFRFVSLKLK